MHIDVGEQNILLKSYMYQEKYTLYVYIHIDIQTYRHTNTYKDIIIYVDVAYANTTVA